jgi:DNA-binding XRE family transcriptional regulator
MFDKNKFKAQIILQGRTPAEVAEHLEISKTTLWRKITGKTEFSRSEINKLIVFLNISDPRDIFFSQEVAEKQH